DAATGAQVEGAEVGDGGGRHADVDDVAPGLAQAAHEAGHHVGTGQAAVAADHDVGQALLVHERADRMADQFGDAGVEGLAHHPADVVGAEDAAVDVHGFWFHVADDNGGRRVCSG